MISVPINKIKGNPKNPRVIKDDKFAKLVKSLREFPQMLEKRPLVCFTDNDGKQGDIVADGFGESGTTMIACDQMQRKAYLQELDPKYCDVIVARYIKHRRSTGSSLVIKRNGQQLSEEDINKYIENTENKQ